MKKRTPKKRELQLRKRPTQRRAQQTYDSILNAAAEILEKEGLKKFNTNYISQKSKVSIGSLYQYFPNKESVIVALIEFQHVKRIEALEELLEKTEGQPIEELIQALIEAVFEIEKMNPRLQQILHEQMFSLGKTDMAMKFDDYLIKKLELFFARNPFKFKLKNRVIGLRMLVHAIKSVSYYSHTDPNFSDEKRLISEVKDLTLRYVGIS